MSADEKKASEGATFSLKNWDEYQHYSDRNPPWIKLYNSILEDRDWVRLQDDSKLIAICFMLLASRTDNEIPADLEYLNSVLPIETEITINHLKTLLNAGFICMEQTDSSMLSSRYQPDSTEGETEREGEKETEREKNNNSDSNESAQSATSQEEIFSNFVSENGGLSGGDVVGLWLSIRDERPPEKQIRKQGAVGKRLAKDYGREDIARAMYGIQHLYPHSDGEAWDLFDLEKKFQKAFDQARNKKESNSSASKKKRFLEAIKDV